MTTAAKCTCTTYGWCAVCRPTVTGFDPPAPPMAPPRARALDYRLLITGSARDVAALMLGEWANRNLSEAADMVDRVLAVFIVHDMAEEEG